MDSTIIVALIVGGLSLFGTIVSSKYISNVRVVKLEMKVDELERKVTKHNGLVERQYKIEERMSLLESRTKATYEC